MPDRHLLNRQRADDSGMSPLLGQEPGEAPHECDRGTRVVRAIDHQLLSLERTLRVDGEHTLVARVGTG
jgi:hypothetical protein